MPLSAAIALGFTAEVYTSDNRQDAARSSLLSGGSRFSSSMPWAWRLNRIQGRFYLIYPKVCIELNLLDKIRPEYLTPLAATRQDILDRDDFTVETVPSVGARLLPGDCLSGIQTPAKLCGAVYKS